jgi:hypothetical protein
MIPMQNPLQVFATAFEARTRADGLSTFWTTRDDAPDWVTDIVRDAHAGAMPCDWRYDKIADLAHELGQVADPDAMDAMEWADRAADVYTSDLLKWLADVTYALEAVDEAATEWGMDTRGVLEMIMAGQCYMLNEMAGRILTDLSDRFAEYLQHEAELTGADI